METLLLIGVLAVASVSMSRAGNLPLLLHVPYRTDRGIAAQRWLVDPEAEDAMASTDAAAAIRRLAAAGRLI